MTSSNGVRISVEETDALYFKADVLALKYAQATYGLDTLVHELLLSAGETSKMLRPRRGESAFFSSPDQLAAKSILIVGVDELYEFGYQQIREFSRCVLGETKMLAPDTKHVALTLHGANYGLDEIEAFESEVAGLIDAISTRVSGA